jgi:hypothetical protein
LQPNKLQLRGCFDSISLLSGAGRVILLQVILSERRIPAWFAETAQSTGFSSPLFAWFFIVQALRYEGVPTLSVIGFPGMLRFAQHDSLVK